jgi:parvulin-like peptidyl-prolyl isomerase
LSQQTITRKNRVARLALVAAVAGALSLPIISQHLKAQEGLGAAGPAGGVPTAPAMPKIDPNAVIASAGAVKVTGADYESFLAGLPPQDQQAIATGSPETRKQIAEHLVKLKALRQEAEKRKLDQDPKVKEQIVQMERQMKAQADAARTNILIQSLVAGLQGDEAGDKKYFEEHPEQFGQVRARHILISTQPGADASKPKLTDEQARKKADDIRARLEKKEDFAKIAKAESDDPGSKDTGGEYTFPRGQMVPAFEQAAFGLKVNEISQPIKTQFGYHVIQLLERLPGKYEDSRNLIGRQRLESFINGLVGGEPKVEPSFLNAPATAPSAPQPGAKPQSAPQPKPAANPK